MKTPLSETNPYGATRYGYLWEVLKRAGSGGSHLDVGSYDGAVPARLLQDGLVSEACAADVVDVAERFAAAMGPAPSSLRFAELRPGDSFPFDDGRFNSASLLDVLEHVADQAALLAEVRRVLRPGGIVVVTVPRQHIFSFLDSGNWKFRFPSLHRRYYVARHSLPEYEARYRNPESGLIGDIEAAKSWHEHFAPQHLQDVLGESGFALVDLDGAGFLARPISLARFALPGRVGRWLQHWAEWDARVFSSTHLFSTFRRQ